MLVEIYSDVVCPWCYIGKRRFEAAMASFQWRDRVEVVWRPFQLDPTAPKQAGYAFDAYAKKFGGPAEAARIIDHVTSVAAGDGLEFHLESALRANTFDAHRLLRLALRAGCQDEVKEQLLRAYFTDSRDVGDRDVLVEIATNVGMRAKDVRASLESDDGVVDIRNEIASAYERGITAVPTFVIDGEWAIPGAQEPDAIIRVLQRRVNIGETLSE